MNYFFYQPEHSDICTSGNDFSDSVFHNLLKTGNECNSADDADAILITEKHRGWYGPSYRNELALEPVFGNFIDKTYVLSFADHAHGLLRGLYVGLRRSIENASMHRAAPYHSGQFPNPLTRRPSQNSSHWESTKVKYLACFLGSEKASVARRKIFRRWSNCENFLLGESGDYANHGLPEHSGYVQSIVDSCFVLCPEGWSPNSFRIFESMALGRCPVIISDQFVPCNEVPWTDFALFVGEHQIDNLEEILLQHHHNWRKYGRIAQEVFHAYFSKSNCSAYYASQLSNLIMQSPKQSRQDVLKWWHSNKVVRGNGWALDQRLVRGLRRRFWSHS